MNTRNIIASSPMKLLTGHEIIYSWKAPDGTDVEVQTFRSDKFGGPDDEGYRPASVKVGGTKVWAFQDSGIRPVAEMVWLDGEDCPFIVGLNSKYVLSVLPTQDFEVAQPISVGGAIKLIGGSSAERLLDLKISIAEVLGLEPDFNKAEKVLMSERAEVARAARLAKKALEAPEVDSKKEERLAARAAFAQELLGRPVMVAYTATGDIRRGTPVMEDELPRLIGEKHYIVVDKDGAPASYFFLNQSKKRLGEVSVSEIKPELMPVTAATTAEPEDMILVKVDGHSVDTPLYRTAADLSLARRRWNRPLVAAFREHTKGTPTGHIVVVRASAKECFDLFKVKPRSEAIAA